VARPILLGNVTSRQSEYENRVFRTGSIYTPQIVVDGHFQAIGSDGVAVRKAIVEAARLEKASVKLRVEAAGATELRTEIQIELPSGLSRGQPLDVIAGVVEDRLTTNVLRGENRGRVLRHTAVTRTLGTIGTIPSTQSAFSQTLSTSIDAGWKKPDLQAVVFVQNRMTRRIVGVGSSAIEARVRFR